MKVKTLVGATAGLTAIVGMASGAVLAASSGGGMPVGKNPPATLKSVPGSPVKRVVLTPKAAERLGIQMGKVDEEPIVRKQMVGGVVVPPAAARPEPKMISSFGGFSRAPSPPPAAVPTKGAGTGEVWVQVALTRGEWENLAKDQPARILPLTTRGEPGSAIVARPSGMPPYDDVKRSMLQLYYVVPGEKHGLTLNKRMRVELQQSGSDEKRKVVPYGALYYDSKGAPWIYVTPEPLGFERQRVRVERIVGDLAVLSEGPPVGTAVVTVGAAMLYGVEVFGK